MTGSRWKKHRDGGSKKAAGLVEGSVDGKPKRETATVEIPVPKGSLYLDVLRGIRDGLSPPAVARQLGITRGHVFGILKSARMRAERMAAATAYDELDQESSEAISMALHDPLWYPMGKIGIGVKKGLGKFKVGDSDAPRTPASNTTIYQNVQILMGMSPEEREKMRERWRREALARADSGHRGLPCVRMDDGNGSSEPAVVGEELHKDV